MHLDSTEEDFSERTCAGCRQHDRREAFVRLAVAPVAPFVVPDLGRKLGGRGISVHPRRACVVSAVQRGGISRSLKREVRVDLDGLLKSLVQAHTTRIEGLLLAAGRRRLLTMGTDATREALGTRVEALLVATDAEGRREELLATASRLGCRAVAFSTKSLLGRLFDRGEVGVIGILDGGIAAEVVENGQRVMALSEAE